jgi:hypothetical protein
MHGKLQRKKEDRGPILMKEKLDPDVYKIAKYFSDKKQQTTYASAKWLLCLQTYHEEESYYFTHPNYWGDHVTEGKALRLLLYGLIVFDKPCIIINETSPGRRIINLFDENIDTKKFVISLNSSIPQKYYNPYTGWKQKWINDLLNTAMDLHDDEVFEKILKKLPIGKYDKFLLDKINNKTTQFQYKAIILRYLSSTNQNEIEL